MEAPWPPDYRHPPLQPVRGTLPLRSIGDTLRAWLGSGPAYGSVRAPEGAPPDGVNQVILLH
jgi:hypothetical protein